MAGVQKPVRGLTYDLGSIAGELRREEAFRREGHTARTLVREDDLRVVFEVLGAGSHVALRGVPETASLRVVEGRVRLQLPDRFEDLEAGTLLVLPPNLPLDVEAITESSLLFTFGWRRRAEVSEKEVHHDHSNHG